MSEKNKWDERYATDDFAYGTEPNDFLRESIQHLPAGGRILCLAEGEGRNAVFLARHGFNVVAVDSSTVGLQKAQKLADENGVQITTIVADLAEFTIADSSFDGVISIFCHLPPAVRSRLHRQVIDGLKIGGTLILEGYTPEQLHQGTGGPPVKELMMTLTIVQDDFRDLNQIHLLETTREILEGTLHTGTGAVVQFIGEKI